MVRSFRMRNGSSKCFKKQQELKDELKETLEAANNVELMKGDAEIAQAISDQYANIPFTTPFMSMA